MSIIIKSVYDVQQGSHSHGMDTHKSVANKGDADSAYLIPCNVLYKCTASLISVISPHETEAGALGTRDQYLMMIEV